MKYKTEWKRPATMNGAKITRYNGVSGTRTIFVSLPPHAWTPIKDGCCCDFCKDGALAVWDTLVIGPDEPTDGKPDYATTCHYPEISQVSS
jgi:hypothetical protein